ncbi:MAG: hypothetical protein AB7D47_02790 [Desulfovibrio sp.]|jgi:nitroimidazol reductase NimA-like FMN-containing flavoprotein (pyridoxamine 5'-phosphate oxidase superfamily)
MRAMTPEEMERLVRSVPWASICVVEPEGCPYVIEATPFFMGKDICFMINPRGGVQRCVAQNNEVLLKFTSASSDLRSWAGVSCRGQGEFVEDEAARQEGWRLLGLVMGQDYSRAAGVLNKKGRSPLFRVQVRSMTGRCNGGWSRANASADPVPEQTEEQTEEEAMQ